MQLRRRFLACRFIGTSSVMSWAFYRILIDRIRRTVSTRINHEDLGTVKFSPELGRSQLLDTTRHDTRRSGCEPEARLSRATSGSCGIVVNKMWSLPQRSSSLWTRSVHGVRFLETCGARPVRPSRERGGRLSCRSVVSYTVYSRGADVCNWANDGDDGGDGCHVNGRKRASVVDRLVSGVIYTQRAWHWSGRQKRVPLLASISCAAFRLAEYEQ